MEAGTEAIAADIGGGFACPLTEEELDEGQAAFHRLFPAPDLRPRNAIPAATLGRARVVTCCAERYMLRRLRFLDGLALHWRFVSLARICALTDPSDADNAEALQLSRELVTMLGSLLRPVDGPGHEPTSFHHLDWADLHALLVDCLTLGDETPQPIMTGDEKSAPLDVLDALASFVHRYPAWVTKRGLPRSWHHFLLGMTHAGRESSRAFLAQYTTTAAAHHGGAEVLPMLARVRALAGAG